MDCALRIQLHFILWIEKFFPIPWIIYFSRPIKGILEKFDGSLVRKLSPGYNILTKLIKEVLNFETFKDKILDSSDDISDKIKALMTMIFVKMLD